MITGIGGIFFKARDPKALAAWYEKHLGLNIADFGGVSFKWTEGQTPQKPGSTIWCPFK